jgi:hypothetical protein
MPRVLCASHLNSKILGFLSGNSEGSSPERCYATRFGQIVPDFSNNGGAFEFMVRERKKNAVLYSEHAGINILLNAEIYLPKTAGNIPSF